MRRWETFLCLLAVILGSLSAIPIGGRPRPLFAFAAIALLFFVGYVRLRTQILAGSKKKPQFDAYERALRIQEDRERKYGR
jgi:hypothetical protein